MKIGAIIQARMGSTRLPGKVMFDLFNNTILEHVVDRVGQCKYIETIIIATTTSKNDDPIVKLAQDNNIEFFRGSEDDVLSRYYYAALENQLDAVVRITSDCPLIDPLVTDNIVKFFLENKYDMVTNGGPELSYRTYPRGLDTEVFSFKALKDAFINGKYKHQREHVTPYIYERYKNIYYYKNTIDYSCHRWTLDTEEDWRLVQEIYKELYKGEHNFYLSDILSVFNKRPELLEINKHVEQKEVK